MGNLRSNMTDEDWDEAERKALMTDDERAMEAAMKDIEKEQDEMCYVLSKTFNDDFYLDYKEKEDE
jgi:hypothetical protein